MYTTINMSDIKDDKYYRQFKLCFIKSIDKTIYDYDEDSKRYMESDEWKAGERWRKAEMDEREEETGIRVYVPNPQSYRIHYVEVPNPEYIKGVQTHYAYFTPNPINEQWGDDWNDTPYEHNAGIPSCYRYIGKDKDGKNQFDEHEIIKVPFYLKGLGNDPCGARVRLPKDYGFGGNSPFSVEDINNGAIPWIWVYGKGKDFNESVGISAGTDVVEFVKKIEIGNKIVDRLEEDYGYRFDDNDDD